MVEAGGLDPDDRDPIRQAVQGPGELDGAVDQAAELWYGWTYV